MSTHGHQKTHLHPMPMSLVSGSRHNRIQFLAPPPKKKKCSSLHAFEKKKLPENQLHVYILFGFNTLFLLYILQMWSTELGICIRVLTEHCSTARVSHSLFKQISLHCVPYSRGGWGLITRKSVCLTPQKL